MVKIQFENGVTKVNADTFNTFQDNIADAVEKNIITAYMQNTKTIQGDSKITVDTSLVIGNKLSLINNSIKIGSGVNHVKVSGNVFATISDDYLWAQIRKNNVAVSIAINSPNTPFVSVSFAERIIEVQENDLIDLFLDSNTADIRGEENTWLTVEVID